MAGGGRDARGKFVGLKLVGDWKQAKDVLASAPEDVDQAIDAALAAVAEFYAGRVKRKIGEGVPPPNSPFTVLLKRSSKTLINKGDLRNGIRAVKLDRFKWFVGIPAGLTGGKNGQGLGQLAKLAEVMEEGRVIVMRMTDKQRKFLHAKLGSLVSKVPSPKGSTGILVIHIPARPFIKPTFEAERASAGSRFESYLRKNLKRLKGE